MQREESPPTSGTRHPLTRHRVLATAVEVADQEGLNGLTMRNLAAALGVEAMSLYYHVANKEALLDGVVELVVDEILEEVNGLPEPPDEDWKTAMRTRILTARSVLLRHPWAPALIETRTTMSPGIAVYYEGLLGLMRGGGFSEDLAHHAMHALGSRAVGFTQELFDPGDAADEAESTELFEQMADQLPNLVWMLGSIVHDGPEATLGWCDDQTEFEFGLDLILDGLERLSRQEAGVPG